MHDMWLKNWRAGKSQTITCFDLSAAFDTLNADIFSQFRRNIFFIPLLVPSHNKGTISREYSPVKKSCSQNDELSSALSKLCLPKVLCLMVTMENMKKGSLWWNVQENAGLVSFPN